MAGVAPLRMRVRLAALPPLVLAALIGSAAMLIPALHGMLTGDEASARPFLQAGLLFTALAALVAIARAGASRGHPDRSQLLGLLGTFALVPLLLAVPLVEAVPGATMLGAYFEMVSALTTTGATVFPDPALLSDTVHLWRATVGWAGGLFMWVAAAAILSPMSLGGFEIGAPRPRRRLVGGRGRARLDRAARLARAARTLAPIYAGLTGALFVALLIVGERPLVALCHAMSTLSTSGISPVGGLAGGAAGIPGEVIVALFLVFALSRATFDGSARARMGGLSRDPELRLAALIVGTVALLLFARHFAGAAGTLHLAELPAATAALWGATFTALSFLSTSGFESADWAAARGWSGLPAAGLILMGLAIFGGGIATTAGGVKLFRCHALMMHGLREMDRLTHPSSVGGSGAAARRVRRQGAYAAWVFFMLFALSIAAVMLLLAATGLVFEDALILTVAALCNVGPLAAVAGDTPVGWAALDDVAKLIAVAAMIVGRLETLAILALLNPELWRG